MNKNEEFNFPEIDMAATGKNIRRLCREKEISVKEIQKHFHIASNQAIYEWFNGKSLPSLDNLVALSELLDKSMNQIIVCKSIHEEEDVWEDKE